MTDTSLGVVEQDIALLRHHGLPMSVDEAGRWRTDAVIPGFALRLTKAEASVVWAWCVAYRSPDRPLAHQATSVALSEAVATLLEGLRRFHKGSEVMDAAGAAMAGPEASPVGEPERRLKASELTGEARQVHRRLRILDLVERQWVTITRQLAAVLDVSERTIHDDLNVLRYSGLKIKFCRRSQRFQAQGLNSYLADCLTPPMAAALLHLFKPPNAARNGTSGATRFSVASEKLAKSIRLIFARNAENLQELMASYRASGVEK
ncbi:MAG: DeoR family transcriptional regulator [Phycisphaerales bacterium]|nr:MAG: DeoR family transcriptional regulator [Phycisphaerales bacterium]